MQKVNILNGDCAYDGWLKAGLSGTALVWRENYLQGAIPAAGDLSEFNRIRADELHECAQEWSAEEIFAELTEMHRKLFSLTPSDSLVLWFDVCPFDRAMLARILFLLNSRSDSPKISLIFRDVVWDAETFRLHCGDAVRLAREDLAYGAEQWRAYCRGAKPDTLLMRFPFS